MSKLQITPEPWRVEGTHSSPCISSGDSSGDDYRIIAELYGAKYPEMEADFALMAAAPDLLRACEWILTDMTFAAPETFVGRAYRWQEAAQIALDKAKGITR